MGFNRINAGLVVALLHRIWRTTIYHALAVALVTTAMIVIANILRKTITINNNVVTPIATATIITQKITTT